MSRYTLLIFACAALTVPIASCGGGDGDSTPVDPGNPIQLSGYVLKGNVVGAAVNVHTILATGNAGAVIAGPFTTDASGHWSGEVPSGTSGAYAVVATGGTYTDEATGNTVSLLSELRGVVIVGQSNVGNATPITHAIFDNAVYRVGLGASVDAAFISAIGDMTTAIGFDPTTVIPAIPVKSYSAGIADIDIYNVILAGFSELLDANPILSPAFDNAETWDLVRAVATDLTDGKLDGVAIDGNIIFVDPDGTGQTSLPLPALDADDISNLVDAANAWAAVNFPGITIPPIDLTAFGNPAVIPPTGWTVTGSLEVTGADASLLGEDNGPNNPVTFTPTAVDVATSGSAASGIDGFVFYVDDIFHSIGMTIDPVGVREVVSVSAFAPSNSWFTAGSSPIGGASMSLLGLTYVLRFIDVELSGDGGQTTTIILNGSLDVRQSTD